VTRRDHPVRSTRAQKIDWLRARPELWTGIPVFHMGCDEYHRVLRSSLWGPRIAEIALLMVDAGLYSPRTLPCDVKYGAWRCVLAVKAETKARADVQHHEERDRDVPVADDARHDDPGAHQPERHGDG
jgi:hypothetical protein